MNRVFPCREWSLSYGTAGLYRLSQPTVSWVIRIGGVVCGPVGKEVLHDPLLLESPVSLLVVMIGDGNPARNGTPWSRVELPAQVDDWEPDFTR